MVAPLDPGTSRRHRLLAKLWHDGVALCRSGVVFGCYGLLVVIGVLPCLVAALSEPDGVYIASACIVVFVTPVFLGDRLRERPLPTMIALIFSGYVALGTISCILTLIATVVSIIIPASSLPLVGGHHPTDLYHILAILSLGPLITLVAGVLLHPDGDIPAFDIHRLVDLSLRTLFSLLLIAIIPPVLLALKHVGLSMRWPLIDPIVLASASSAIIAMFATFVIGFIALILTGVALLGVGWLQERLGQPIGEFLTLLRDLRPILPAIVGFTSIYAAIMLAFGSLYDALDLWSPGRLGPAPFTGVPPRPTWWDFIHFAISIFPPLGNNDIKPTNALTQALVDLELLVGVAWVSIVLAAVTRHIGGGGTNVGDAGQAVAPGSNAPGSNATPGAQDRTTGPSSIT